MAADGPGIAPGRLAWLHPFCTTGPSACLIVFPSRPPPRQPQSASAAQYVPRTGHAWYRLGRTSIKFLMAYLKSETVSIKPALLLILCMSRAHSLHSSVSYSAPLTASTRCLIKRWVLNTAPYALNVEEKTPLSGYAAEMITLHSLGLFV